MRSKEEANDYRYFPDPDLLPVEITSEEIERIRAQLPELPDAMRDRFVRELGLSEYDSATLTANKDIAHYFETCLQTGGDAKICANWIMGELSATLNRENIEINESPLKAEQLGGLILRIKDGTLSNKIAKQVFETMWNSGKDADSIIEAEGLQQVSDVAEIEKFVDDVIGNNPQQVEQYRNSPEEKRGKLIGFFVGQVMKTSKGKANPQEVNRLLKSRLES